jgi:DNA-directed RNA polymerase subunit M/transcription elongation factor TFIIS
MQHTHLIFVDALSTGDERDPVPDKEAKVLWNASGKYWKFVLMWLTDPIKGMERRRTYLCCDSTTPDVVNEAKRIHADTLVRRHVAVNNWVPTTEYTCGKCKSNKCERSVDQMRRSDEEARLLVRCTLCVDLPPWQPSNS